MRNLKGKATGWTLGETLVLLVHSLFLNYMCNILQNHQNDLWNKFSRNVYVGIGDSYFPSLAFMGSHLNYCPVWNIILRKLLEKF